MKNIWHILTIWQFEALKQESSSAGYAIFTTPIVFRQLSSNIYASELQQSSFLTLLFVVTPRSSSIQTEINYKKLFLVYLMSMFTGKPRRENAKRPYICSQLNQLCLNKIKNNGLSDLCILNMPMKTNCSNFALYYQFSIYYQVTQYREFS